MINNEELRKMVNTIDEVGHDLTSWEIQFISNIIDNDLQCFSPKQAEQIERIYQEKVD